LVKPKKSMSEYFRAIKFRSQHLFQIALIIAFLIFYICSCKKLNVDDQFQSIEKNQLPLSGINIDYPGDGTIFPPEFPSPQFLWEDTLNASTKWHIRLSTQGGKEIYREIRESSTWRPDSAVWLNIKTASATEPVFFTIIGEREGILGSKFSSGRVSFTVSKDSVGAPVFYRAVPLPFGYTVKHVDEIEWYSGRVDGGKPQRVLENIPVCANCHSFSNSGLVAMDVDYANDKGSYIIAPATDTVHLTYDKVITWSDYKREYGELTFGLLSQISPDGKYVLSTVKDRSVFVPVDNLEYSQLFFPIKGIIAIYDRDANKYYELPGASDPAYVQSNPNWSPDGREILFSKTIRYRSPKIEATQSVLLTLADVEEFVSRRQPFKYDLYRVPFNNCRGGQAVPVPGASNNNKSNFFARYSPDGKWVVFCQADNFMLLQPDSKLYIMPASGGIPRLMNCNTSNMNSWHSWSPNSKWLVFSTKIRGPYTQLYLTHIDENGNDSPPVFLENLAFNTRAANIPEFLPPKAAGMLKMVDDFSRNAVYYTRLADFSKTENKYKDALKLLEDAIKTDNSYYDTYELRIYINFTLRNSRSKDDLHDRMIAREIIDKQIQQNPKDKSLYLKRGHLRLMNDDYEGALKDGMYVLKLKPNDYGGLELITAIYQEMGQPDKAITYQKKMLELQPDNINHTYNLALLYNETKQQEQALELLNKLISINPKKADFYIARANYLLNKENYPAAKADFDMAISVDPKNYNTYRARSYYDMITSSPDMARSDLTQAITLLGEDIGTNPQNAPLYFVRAEIMEQMGDSVGALNEYESYLKSWPLNFSILKNEAQIYLSQKQWQKAIDTYTTIIDNFPERTQFLYDRSRAYEQLGNLQKALDDINNAIRIYPKEYSCYYFRAIVKNQLGDLAGCNNDLKSTVALLNELSTKRKLNQEEQNILSLIQKQLD
jgi:tetratricopeptide (TPR) repeat protein